MITSNRGIDRRGAVMIIAGAGAAAILGSCERRASGGEVVLYSSADDEILRSIVGAFEK
ncbi:MAG: hypothetical protein IT301_09170, partial [Dehalococcoidia bacterium]|nr:hypothetical protein [Dehalococcoidia bacterium]